MDLPKHMYGRLTLSHSQRRKELIKGEFKLSFEKEKGKLKMMLLRAQIKYLQIENRILKLERSQIEDLMKQRKMNWMKQRKMNWMKQTKMNWMMTVKKRNKKKAFFDLVLFVLSPYA